MRFHLCLSPSRVRPVWRLAVWGCLFILSACSTGSTAVSSSTTADQPVASTVAPIPTTTTTIVEQADPARNEGWVSDLELLRERIPRMHPNPFWRVPEAAWNADVDDVIRRVPELEDRQIELEVMRLVAQIDGHTALSPASVPLEYRMYQIRMYGFEDGWFVVEAAEPDLVGSRVVSVGGQPIDEVIDAVTPYVPYDNRQTIRNLAPLYAVNADLLAGIGIVADVESPSFELETADGESVGVDPPVLGPHEWREWASSTVALPPTPGMLAGDRADEEFWWTYLPEDAAVYVQYNRVASVSHSSVTGESTSIGALADQLEEVVGREPVERVVVDMRRNPGGDNTTFRPLLDFLVEWEAESDGLLVMVTGRQTFSAAANFATLVDVRTDALFVGEGMGGSPNGYGDTRPLRLPYSGLTPRISGRYWEMGGPDDDRTTIHPAAEVLLNSEGYFAGNDTALDIALGLVPPPG